MKNPFVCELHTILPDLFTEPDAIVIDLGLNYGSFATTMIEVFDTTVVGVEPMPELFSKLPKSSKLTAYEVAIAQKNGTATLFTYMDRCSSLSSMDEGLKECSIEVTTWTFSFLLEKIERKEIDLVKIDIEGEECSLIESTTPSDFRKCRQISIEFHDFLMPETKGRVEAAKKKLRSIGFREICFSMNNGDVLFVREDLISKFRLLYLRWLYKYSIGIRRWLKRRIKLAR